MAKPQSPAKILLIDDEPNILKTMRMCLEDLGHDISAFQNPEAALAAIPGSQFDLAFVDLKMTPIDGMVILQAFREHAPQTTVAIITAHGSIESAVEAIKNGAHDYLQKPFDYLELQIFAQKMLNFHRLKAEVFELREQARQMAEQGELITRNPKMRDLLELALRAAETDMSILIEGESGTGKGVLARMIHRHSARAHKPLVTVNCAALPENLLESELFGHVKGAFTGAIKDRLGRFELANDGTIFLDEIGELPPAVQAKLLRVLQDGEFEKLGESRTRKVDVRIIAATNRNLREAMENGHFREDLFYRLNTVRLKLLPLQERPEDVPVLIAHFLQKFSPNPNPDLQPEARLALLSYGWPGNVRELENAIQRAALLTRQSQISLQDLPDEIHPDSPQQKKPLSLEELEKRQIDYVLSITESVSEASQILGIDPATLWRKRKKYGLAD